MTLSTGQSIGSNGETTSIWPTTNFTTESGYTIDFRLKVIDDPANPEQSRGSFGIVAAPADSDLNSFLTIATDEITWRGNGGDIVIPFDNTADFSDYRIVQVPGQANQFFVWRDGVLVNPGGVPFVGREFVFFSNRMVAGDLGSNIGGTTDLEYLRFTKGTPFATGVDSPTVDFGISKNLDIGPDRVALEETTQTFTANSPVTLTNHVWTVTLNSVTVATGNGETFDFTPTQPGEYIVSVTADDVGGSLTDQLVLTVEATTPLTDVLTLTPLPAAENTPVMFAATVNALSSDTIEFYNWFVLDSSGNVLEQSSGGPLSQGGFIPAFTFTPMDQGLFRIGLDVHDSEGHVETRLRAIDVVNVAPQVIAFDTNTVTGNGSAMIAGMAFDTPEDFLLGDIDFGDGTKRPLVLKEDSSFQAAHEYETPGTYQVTVTVFDEDGNSQQQAYEVIFDPSVSIATVNSTADSGAGSLRAAIEMANNGEINVIEFDIEGSGPHVIDVLSPLPTLTIPVTIDGTSEPDYQGSPVVGLNGSLTTGSADGLRILGSDITVMGLAIYDFGGDGIEIINGGSHTISNNYVGLDLMGNAAGNFHGVKLVNSASNLIDNNVLSGNRRTGVFVNSALIEGSTFINNKIGTNPDGTQARPNGTDGMTIYSANNTIGRPGEGNLVGGNTRWGILTTFANRGGNTLLGNKIGTDITGQFAIPNSVGILIQNEQNQIGGTQPGAGNLISGNATYGVAIARGTADENRLHGNLIGTDDSGTGALGNGSYGIRITRGADNQVGGMAPGQANVISGNGESGVLVGFSGATNNQIVGNKIGTDMTGQTAIGNAKEGVRFIVSASDNVVSENQIAGNVGRGITTDRSSSGNDILFNLIGTNPDASAPLHNGTGGALRLQAAESLIEGNTISAPDLGILALRDATDLVIKDNFIGTDETETVDLGMSTAITLISGANDNLVSGNTIANNVKGVVVPNGQGNRITGNSIYNNSSIGIDLGPGGTNGNDLGDVDTGANNLQNSPELFDVTLVGNVLTITYSVDSTAQSSAYPMTIEFFISDGNGQGRTLIGTNTYLTSERRQQKTIQFGVTGLNVGDKIVATATDLLGNTSEFGEELTVG